MASGITVIAGRKPLFDNLLSEGGSQFSLRALKEDFGADRLAVKTKRMIPCTGGPHGVVSRYSISSSTRARIFGGIVRPRAFAAVRLTSSLKIAACCTGSSAGAAPLRILSAQPAACRNSSSWISASSGGYSPSYWCQQCQVLLERRGKGIASLTASGNAFNPRSPLPTRG